jgi:hypothetical protein
MLFCILSLENHTAKIERSLKVGLCNVKYSGSKNSNAIECRCKISNKREGKMLTVTKIPKKTTKRTFGCI